MPTSCAVRYPELRLTYRSKENGACPCGRAYAKVQVARYLHVTVDPSEAFRPFCWSSCGPLMKDFTLEYRGWRSTAGYPLPLRGGTGR